MKKVLFTLGVVAVATMAMAQTSLTFNPAKGAKYEYDFNTAQDITQNIMGQDVPMKQDMTFVYEMQVSDKTAGEVKAIFKYKAVKYNLSSMMMNMHYDSKTPAANPTQTDAVIAKIFGGIIGKPFNVVIASNGSIKSVSGMDAIVNEVMGTLGDDAQAKMIGQALKGQLSDEAVKAMFEQSMKIYPDAPVKIGDTWNAQQSLGGSGMSFDMNTTYTLKSVSGTTAFVDLTSKVTGMGGKLNGTQSGQIEFNLATGLPLKSNATQNIKGTVNANGMEVKMEIASKIVVTTREVR